MNARVSVREIKAATRVDVNVRGIIVQRPFPCALSTVENDLVEPAASPKTVSYSECDEKKNNYCESDVNYFVQVWHVQVLVVFFDITLISTVIPFPVNALAAAEEVDNKVADVGQAEHADNENSDAIKAIHFIPVPQPLVASECLR